MARAPLDRVQVTPHGGWRAVRTDPDLCPGKPTPCVHPGVDLAAAAGELVHAPEDGVIVVSRPVKYKTTDRPFTGYHPGVILMLGNSGTWHLLAHLRPSQLKYLRNPDLFAIANKLDVATTLTKVARGQMAAPMPDSRFPLPTSLVFSELTPIAVEEGEAIGAVAGLHRDPKSGKYTRGHVHWETRVAPLAGGDATGDPFAWLLSQGAPAPRAKGSQLWLLGGLLLLLAFSRR